MQSKYTVNGNLKDDTGYHETGDIVLKNDDEAAPLLAIGRLEPFIEDTMTASGTGSQNMVATPDGFPQHDTMTASKVDVQPDSQSQPVAAAAPATETVTQPVADANPDAAQQTPPQTASKQPTQEQVAQDMAQLG